MSMMVNDAGVERVFNAFVEALTDDSRKLITLLHILNEQKEITGLGYIISNVIQRIEETLDY
mgnify:CR=1 FL=1